jgi:hypothetical protein
VAWRFEPDQARLALTLPRDLGGGRHARCLVGGYTFTPEPRAAA